MNRPASFWAALVSAAIVSAACADVTPSSLFTSHMVVQREMPLPVWGRAAPGEGVSVAMDDAPPVTTKTDAQGRWKVVLPARKADGKAHRMTIAGTNRIELEDVLIGEVWLGAGQSNMGVPYDAPAALAEADFAKVRLFNVPMRRADTPQEDLEPRVAWETASAETMGKKFSGTLGYFGLRLQKELGVPVGLVHSAVGGTKIQMWTPCNPPEGENACFYNSMIAPLAPLAIRGVVWYQGEANAPNGLAYAPRFKTMIESWRGLWGRELPFYYVQLPPFGYDPYVYLPPMWEAQASCLKLPRTGMVVAHDCVDDVDDIHCTNKHRIGNRLALWALARDYGRKDLVYSGPMYKAMKVEGPRVRLSFAHAAGGLTSTDGKELTSFEIAGPDGKLVDAEARIEGATVVVWAKGVADPRAVRFGWHTQCYPNLVNMAGLPAGAFHTDGWQGGTGEEASPAAATGPAGRQGP